MSFEVFSKQSAADALEKACEQVRLNLPLYTYQCQNHSSVDGLYPGCPNNQWTTGFWPGEIWLAYEFSGEARYLDAASILVQSFLKRIEEKIEVDHHDMGFLYSPSCVSAWKLSGNEDARRAAILAARQLCSRFHEKGAFIQAWGPLGAPENYRFIIDCLLNLPLLYWASEETGDPYFASIADRHAATTLKYSFREDGSSHHTFYMDPASGKPLYGRTCQGYSDESFWARGQAWAVYGAALGYSYTKEEKYIEVFKRSLDFYLSRLPEDLVPYWDMIFTAEDEEPRDSSSAAIVACGLLEAARRFGDEKEKAAWKKLAARMLQSLYEDYSTPEAAPGKGQILHGTYSKKSPYNTCTPEGVDEYTAWGDYFYMEALSRYLRPERTSYF